MLIDILSPLQNLSALNCSYAFYFRREGEEPFFQYTRDRFIAASLVKIPILLAWVFLERAGEVSRSEICDLEAVPAVQGAGFAWLLRQRQLPYQDVLLMMMALSDNLCANLILRRLGLERLNRCFHEMLGLPGALLQRKFMDGEARAQGLENILTAPDCIRFFDLFQSLTVEERAWVEPILAACQDSALLLRAIPRDLIIFHHKTGSLPGVLHDWGYTQSAQIFLLTQNGTDETAICEVFGRLGNLLLT